MKMAHLLLLLLVILSQCHNSKEKNNNAQPISNEQSINDTSSAVQTAFLHGIVLQTTDLTVSQAFLTNDAGQLISPDRTVHRGEVVYLNLAIKNGWMAVKGKVTLGATQRIESDKGEPILTSGDLFAHQQALTKKEARHLQLQAVITKSRPDIRFVTISFRVWDKSGPAEITGSYRLSLARE